MREHSHTYLVTVIEDTRLGKVGARFSGFWASPVLRIRDATRVPVPDFGSRISYTGSNNNIKEDGGKISC
jgi:hypothetical protein